MTKTILTALFLGFVLSGCQKDLIPRDGKDDTERVLLCEDLLKSIQRYVMLPEMEIRVEIKLDRKDPDVPIMVTSHDQWKEYRKKVRSAGEKALQGSLDELAAIVALHNIPSDVFSKTETRQLASAYDQRVVEFDKQRRSTIERSFQAP